MIEIICKEDPAKESRDKKEKTISLPKNIRQVGSPRGRHKIYVEDYVYTYLRNMAKEQEKCAAVFLGNSQVEKDIRYTFISGVTECSGAVFQWDSISLDESFWDYIYKEEKQYFPESEIVGWFLGKAGQAMELPPAIEAAHRKYFSGRDKVLMLMDILEDEERFFVYEQGYLQKREGYYIYYEKNLAMQEYMISKREEEQLRQEQRKLSAQQPEEEIKEIPELKMEPPQETPQEESSEARWDQEDPPPPQKEEARTSERDAKAMLEQMRRQEKRAERKIREGAIRQKGGSPNRIFVKSNLEEPKSQAEEALDAFRRTALERQGARRQRQSRNLLYTASSFMLVVICVIGITTINNYRKMQEVEEVLRMISPKSQESQREDSEGNQKLVVENIESQVSPLDPSSKDTPDASKPEESFVSEQEEPSETSEPESPQTDNQQEGSSRDSQQESPAAPEETEQKPDSQPKEDSGDSENSDGSDNTQETSSSGQTGEPRYYTVQPGDTLNTICLDLYQSKEMVKKIKELNDIEDGDKILVGQKLLLP